MPNQGGKINFYYSQEFYSITLKQNTMSLLEQAKEITSSEYLNLKDPIFKGQTRLYDDLTYWMLFEDSNVLYKILHTL